ncbi:hypothetical protein GCM10011578_096170 [Streptomyces fuscichromogenes]|uniref:Mutator family transposase n=1 Tax=Streptomyces fuscichromogenes TaxID=1324013 RepID=A0A917XQ77_9ACTN|nr:hypothetical protein GCM10011578_096170 [Streptomyces fuscichromogenes]
MVLSLSAKGLTHGEVAAHLAEVYGAQVSKQAISTITDKVMDGMAEWQSCPPGRVYPVFFVDAINVKIRDGQVANRPVYVVRAVRAVTAPATSSVSAFRVLCCCAPTSWWCGASAGLVSGGWSGPGGVCGRETVGGR